MADLRRKPVVPLALSSPYFGSLEDIERRRFHVVQGRLSGAIRDAGFRPRVAEKLIGL
jgi:hypothetical protein